MSRKLAEADATSILQVSRDLKKDKDRLRPEVMYVAAIRLYDLGQKDEAVYWFYTAQYRARVFTAILDKEKIGSIGATAFELKQAYVSFNVLAGPSLNGYAFGELPKLEKTLMKVLEENERLPKFGEIYPRVRFEPQENWAAKSKDVATGLAKLLDYIKTDANTIKEIRKKNGMEGKF